MKQGNEFPESILDTEQGMFRIELAHVVEESEMLIGASVVSDDIKKTCCIILNKLVARVELEKNKKDTMRPDSVEDISRMYIVKLLDSLDQKDNEQKGLYESLRDLILSARNSTKGWK